MSATLSNRMVEARQTAGLTMPLRPFACAARPRRGGSRACGARSCRAPSPWASRDRRPIRTSCRRRARTSSLPSRCAPNRSDAGGHARAAGRHHRLGEIDPGRVEHGAQRVAALPAIVGVEELALRQVARARDMARTRGPAAARPPRRRSAAPARASTISWLPAPSRPRTPALSTTASSSSKAVKWPWRCGSRPLASGRPSAFHFCRPPSSKAT